MLQSKITFKGKLLSKKREKNLVVFENIKRTFNIKMCFNLFSHLLAFEKKAKDNLIENKQPFNIQFFKVAKNGNIWLPLSKDSTKLSFFAIFN